MGLARSPRVLVVSQQFPPDKGGNASRIHDTARHLVDEGWDVTVVAAPPSFPHGRFDRDWRRKVTGSVDGVTVHRLWAWQPSGEDPGFLSRMAYYLSFPVHASLWLVANHRRYDVVITTSPPIFTGVAGLVAGILGDVPWLADVRDLWIDASIGLGFVEDGSVVERLSRAFERRVLSAADRISVTTVGLGDRLVSRYGLDSEKVVHVPNGVDVDRFRADDREREPTIIYTGNVGHAQDLESCIRAMALVDDSDAKLIIVGDGDLRSDLESLAAELGLDGRVEFTGLVEREVIPEFLATAAVGVAPLKNQETLEYAVPSKAYEYMASGLPVVATGSGEIERLLEESGGGLVVENDSERLAAAFDTLLTDDAARTAYGESGRVHVEGHYDRKAIASHLDEALRSMLG